MTLRISNPAVSAVAASCLASSPTDFALIKQGLWFPIGDPRVLWWRQFALGRYLCTWPAPSAMCQLTATQPRIVTPSGSCTDEFTPPTQGDFQPFEKQTFNECG